MEKIVRFKIFQTSTRISKITRLHSQNGNTNRNQTQFHRKNNWTLHLIWYFENILVQIDNIWHHRFDKNIQFSVLINVRFYHSMSHPVDRSALTVTKYKIYEYYVLWIMQEEHDYSYYSVYYSKLFALILILSTYTEQDRSMQMDCKHLSSILLIKN